MTTTRNRVLRILAQSTGGACEAFRYVDSWILARELVSMAWLGVLAEF